VFQICREKAPLTICTGVVDAVVAARALRCQRTGGDCEVRRVMVPRTRPDGLAGIDGW
jgi:ATP-dependent 26S proteasome regulatory subunit